MNNQRVLIVDDEAGFRRTLARSLRGHGYEVRESATGSGGIEDCREFQPEVVLLDLMLPDISGLLVCRELHQASDAAIIVLSVMRDQRTKVRALDEGADDYLTKPFKTAELLARIRAVLRRSPTAPQSDSILTDSDAIKIDSENRLVFLNGNEVRLTRLEFRLLELFVLNPGKVLRQQEILAHVWGEEHRVDAQLLRTYVKQLRAKLGDSSTAPSFIRTEPGIGYRYLANLRT